MHIPYFRIYNIDPASYIKYQIVKIEYQENIINKFNNEQEKKKSINQFQNKKN